MTSAANLAVLEPALTRNAMAFLRRAIAATTDAGATHQELTFAVVDLAVATEVLEA